MTGENKTGDHSSHEQSWGLHSCPTAPRMFVAGEVAGGEGLTSNILRSGVLLALVLPLIAFWLKQQDVCRIGRFTVVRGLFDKNTGTELHH